jgi:hypothetical protein
VRKCRSELVEAGHFLAGCGAEADGRHLHMKITGAPFHFWLELREQLRGLLFHIALLLEHIHERLAFLEWAHVILQVLEVVDTELRPL